MKHTHRILPLSVSLLFSPIVARYDGAGDLPLQVDALEAVPEAVRGLYAPTEDKKAFRLKVSGLPDVTKLEGALAAERLVSSDFKKKAQAIADKYKDVDADKYRELMSKLEGDEDAKLLKEGGLEKVLERRTEKMREKFNSDLKAKDDELGASRSRLSKLEQRALDSHVRAAATKAGIHSSAIDDALLRARSKFTLNPNDDSVVEMGEDGKPVLDSSGKKPFTVEQWFEERKKDAGHWFPHGSKGSGSQGKGNEAGGKKTMTRSTWDAITDAGEKAKAARENTITDD